jgi:hypothetical protein
MTPSSAFSMSTRHGRSLTISRSECARSICHLRDRVRGAAGAWSVHRRTAGRRHRGSAARSPSVIIARSRHILWLGRAGLIALPNAPPPRLVPSTAICEACGPVRLASALAGCLRYSITPGRSVHGLSPPFLGFTHSRRILARAPATMSQEPPSPLPLPVIRTNAFMNF